MSGAAGIPVDGDALWAGDLYDLHASAERVHWWFTGRRSIVQAVAAKVLAGITRPLVIDVGCGTGANVEAMAKHYDAVGIEPSAHAVAIARRLFPSLRFITGHAPEDLGELAARCDLFLLTDVMEHVRDDFALLSRILAGAKPGAHVLITVPADESLWSRHDETLGHFRRYTRERLAEVWEGLPVTTRLLSPFNARLYPLVRAARRTGALFGGSVGAEGTDVRVPPRPLNRLLDRVLAGEAARLVVAMDGGGSGYARGVSLIAVVRREAGVFEARSKPARVREDRLGPDPSMRAAQ